MLFSPSGIELSGYRYNIGGGGAGVTTADRAPKDCPRPTPPGLTFLPRGERRARPGPDRLRQRARRPRFTTNGKACGGALVPGMEVAYAKYLTGVVRALHDHDHITLQFVSPMNEPDDSFADCGQEGMQVPVSQRAPVVRALGRELAQHAPYTKVIADETTADAILSDRGVEVARRARHREVRSRRSRITPTTSPPTRSAGCCRRSRRASSDPRG